MTQPPRKRRSLSHLGGAIQTVGDAEDARRAAHALAVVSSTEAEDDPARAHVHGFHSYPARMHPETAHRLVEAFTSPGERILDPFCGSGTVLVEARLLGRPSLGIDLNPLAVRLAQCKNHQPSPTETEHLLQRAAQVAESADARRKARAGASRRFLEEDVARFEPHVLLELDSLRSAIQAGPDDAIRMDLSLILSAILVKLSRQEGDTTQRLAPRKTAPGFPARFFLRKTDDLVRRREEFRTVLPPRDVPVDVFLGDALKLRPVPGNIAAIVTSPPYAATYDYAAHHALRMRWLGLDTATLIRNEMGARAHYRTLDADQARTRWKGELLGFLKTAAQILQPGAPLVMVMADSAVRKTALRADAIVAEVARDGGFHPAACASQTRPHFHGPTQPAFRNRPRAEHAIVLRRAR